VPSFSGGGCTPSKRWGKNKKKASGVCPGPKYKHQERQNLSKGGPINKKTKGSTEGQWRLRQLRKKKTHSTTMPVKAGVLTFEKVDRQKPKKKRGPSKGLPKKTVVSKHRNKKQKTVRGQPSRRGLNRREENRIAGNPKKKKKKWNQLGPSRFRKKISKEGEREGCLHPGANPGGVSASPAKKKKKRWGKEGTETSGGNRDMVETGVRARGKRDKQKRKEQRERARGNIKKRSKKEKGRNPTPGDGHHRPREREKKIEQGKKQKKRGRGWRKRSRGDPSFCGYWGGWKKAKDLHKGGDGKTQRREFVGWQGGIFEGQGPLMRKPRQEMGGE